jgi:serine/threonine protein kinase
MDNIMLQKKDQIKIIDFGLSVQLEKDKPLTSLVGTSHYVSPQVISGSYDEKCDIWALGIVAYQLFSQGQYPFDGDNEVQIAKKIRKGKFYLPPKPKRY